MSWHNGRMRWRSSLVMFGSALALLSVGACSDEGLLGEEPFEPSDPGANEAEAPTGGGEAPGEAPAVEGEDLEESEAPTEPPPADTCPRVRVDVGAGRTLNLRKTASTSAAVVDALPNNTIVSVVEKVKGEAVSGNAAWYKVNFSPNVGYVSAAFAACTTAKSGDLTKTKEFRLPLTCKTTARISQGNNGGFSHSGKAKYAFDFAIPVGTPLTAMADGVVLYTYDKTKPGDPCYNGGGSSCFPYANYVVLRHGDGTASIYKHLSKVQVNVGDFVPSGTAVGLSGSTGYSTGPHAHVMRQEECGAPTTCQSIPVKFADVPGSGVPATGQTVTSANGCPPPKN